MRSLMFKKLRNQRGQGTVEYALLTLAVVIIIGAVLLATPAGSALGTAITNAFTAVSTEVTNQTGS